MNWPTINEDRCVQAAQACLDPRCSDPTFAINNPGICGVVAQLVIGPETALACAPYEINFSAVLRSPAGDVAVTEGVTWSTSDASVVAINSTSGQATAVSTGVATITATWQDYSAFAQMTVLGTDGTCCDNVTVLIAAGLDNSLSMGQAFDGGYSTKLDAGKALASAMLGAVLEKDQAAVWWFNTSSGMQQGLTNDVTTLQAAVGGILPTSNQTNLSGAFDALAAGLAAGTGNVRVMLIVSDGASHPVLTTSQRADLIAKAKAFRNAGNIVFCVGVRAVGDGYQMLESIASGGFFVNVWGGSAAVQAAIGKLQCSLGYFCAGSRPAVGYPCAGFNCCDEPIGAQSPDPSKLWDLEDGDPPGRPPLLPAVVFSPASGTERNGGLSVLLSVPQHPNATIRYTMDRTDNPPAPTFGGPGQDYVGGWVPVNLPGAGGTNGRICIKAIARELGYTESQVSLAFYIQSGTVPGQLSGLRWEMPVARQLGELLGSCDNPAPQSLALQGDVGRTYNVTMRFRGIVEPFGDYTGTKSNTTKAYQNLKKPGDNVPTLYEYDGGCFVTGGTFPSNTVGNTYKLVVSDPPQTYYLNGVPTDALDVPSACMMIDYQQTIPIRTGATVTLEADAHDGYEVCNSRSVQGNITLFPLVVPGVPPYPNTSLGQFVQMDVLSVV